ncbi:hypothetical protein GCM10022221_50440 [Actinocorallia aurea]
MLASGRRAGLLVEAEEAAGVVGVDAARGGEHDAAARAGQKGDAQVARQGRDGGRDRGFGHVQAFRGTPDRAGLGQRDESAQS